MTGDEEATTSEPPEAADACQAGAQTEAAPAATSAVPDAVVSSPSQDGEEPSPYAATGVAHELLDPLPDGVTRTLAARSDLVARPATPWDSDLATEHPGRYVGADRLGEGSFGAVFEVYDTHLDRSVALKQLRSRGDRTLLSATEARFVHEARITGKLEHPGIVPVYELGRRADDNAMYYVMRLVRGRTLHDAMKQSEGLHERLKLLPQLVDACNAVAYAHSRGVVHRDLKPDNIMLGPFGATMVVDWGLAKIHGEDDTQSNALAGDLEQLRSGSNVATIDGTALGTPAFMPPEQCLGMLEEINERSDVYALGAVLYDLICGRPPFLEDSLSELLRLTVEGDIDPPTALEPDCPPELEAIVLRALAKVPDDRYPDARALADDISSFLGGGIVGAHRYPATHRLRRWLVGHWMLLAAAFTIVLIVAGTWLYRDWTASSEAATAETQRKIDAENAARARRQQLLGELDTILRDTDRGATKPRWLDTYAFKIVTLAEPNAAAALAQRLAEALTHPSVSVRRLAARSLGGLKSELGVTALTARLAEDGESEEVVLVEIVNALGVIGDQRAEFPVREARERAGRYGRLWEQTVIAYRMIPLPPLVNDGAALSAEAWKNRGRALVDKGDQQGAMLAYGRALDVDPKYGRALTNRANLLMTDELYEQALRDYDKALEIDPHDKKTLYNRAILKRRMEDYEGAIADYSLLTERGKLRKLALRSRANAYRYLGQQQRAQADYDAALELDDRDPRTYKSIGSLHADYRRWHKAIAACDRALALNNSMVSALVVRGYAHRMSGALEVAASDFDRAIELDPSQDSARFNRAALRNTTGDREGALRDLNHCITTKCVREHQNASLRLSARGILGHAVGGDLTAALGDIEQSFKTAHKRSSSINAALYGLALSLRRGGDEERKTWLKRLAPTDKTWWNEKLARLAVGEIDFEQMDAATPFVVGRCKVLLAGGVRRELEGQPREALQHYQAAEEMERPAELACALASVCAASLTASLEE